MEISAGAKGALVAGSIVVFLPHMAKTLAGTGALVVIALLHRHIESFLEDRWGLVAVVVLIILAPPLVRALQGPIVGLTSFFFAFLVVAAGYLIGVQMARDEDDYEETDEW